MIHNHITAVLKQLSENKSTKIRQKKIYCVLCCSETQYKPQAEWEVMGKRWL